ncbi:hypothetical protein PVK06_020781 [Gossypium arboreum]|uniref:UBN2 domain-containing protein n=1 Tax=Gossypium arboreum TaxID=29729 RepID=A0ABR0PN98_GOSAR|nr:hypothetical protein PVK06_020781 [Gossypium arboreum]
MVQQNAKSIHTIFFSLGPDEYNRVSLCDYAKKIWDKLEVTNKGTSRVNESKINLISLNYEHFKVEPD